MTGGGGKGRACFDFLLIQSQLLLIHAIHASFGQTRELNHS